MTTIFMPALLLGSSPRYRRSLRVDGNNSQSGRSSLTLKSRHLEIDTGYSGLHDEDATWNHVRTVTLFVASQVTGTRKLRPARKDFRIFANVSLVGSYV